MSGALLVLAVCAAGGLGAVARYQADRRVSAALRARHPGSRVPWGTLAVNATGSLLLGLLTGAVLAGAPRSLLAVAGTGFCGGYTTFSTAVVQVVDALAAGSARRAVGYATGTLVVSVAAAAAGTAVGAALASTA